MQTHRPRTLAYIALVLTCFFWGTTYLGIAVAIESMTPPLLVASRFTIAGLVFLALALAAGDRLPNLRDLRRNAVVGFALLVCANSIVSWAELYIPSGLTSIIVATTPFAFVGLARFTGEPIPRAVWRALGLGFLAVAILSIPRIGQPELHPLFFPAFFSLFVACFCWAGGSVYARVRPPSTGKLMSAACQNLTAGLFMSSAVGLYVLMNSDTSILAMPSTRSLWALAYLVVFGSLVGYLSYIYCLEHLPAGQVSITPYANTGVAVLIGYLLNDEALDITIILGTLLIFAAIYLVNRSRVKTARA